MAERMRPRDVPGRLTVEAGRVLRRLARSVPEGQLIVEIGAYRGRSTCFLAAGSSEGNGATVLSVDPWGLPAADGTVPAVRTTPEDHAAHVAVCGLSHLVVQRRGYSQQVERPEDPVGLLWIDGAHDEPSVTADVDRWVPLVASGGVVVFDDYRLRCPGVDRTVDRLMADTGPWTRWETAAGRLAIGWRR